MRNYVLMMPWTVIISKIASVILDLQKYEDLQYEDFLSILRTSETTKIRQKMGQNKSNTPGFFKELIFQKFSYSFKP